MQGIKKYKVTIVGITPLRQHRRPLPGDHEIKSMGGRIPTEEETQMLFENARYWEKKIGYFQPSHQIRKALVLSAHNYKVPGKGNTRFSKFVSSAVFIEPEVLVHKNQKDVESIGHWTVREDRGKQFQIWCTKSQVDNWELDFEITNTMPEIVTDKDLKEFLEYAGMYNGIGCDRPGRGKSYGKFEVKSFKVL